MTRLTNVVTWVVLLGWLPATFGEGTLRQILVNGPTDKRINIAFLSEGYQQGQASQFIEDARSLLAAILSTPPLDAYSNYFNGFTIFAPSKAEGSDHPSRGVYKDTYFNSSYDSYGFSQAITIPPNEFDHAYTNGEGKIDMLLKDLLPEWDLRVLIVNDGEYGGSSWGITATAITSLDLSSAEIVVHEVGHSYAGLGDEYDDPYPGYPDDEEPNTTRETNRDRIKWRFWISPTTPIPTPESPSNSALVGLFEGAHYHATNWYRPQLECKMRDLGEPFCRVCAEALVKATYVLVRPIVSSFPPSNTPITLVDTQAVNLAITLLQPTDHNLSVQWFTNNLPVKGETNTAFTIAAQGTASWDQLGPSGGDRLHRRVRTDPQQLLTDWCSWGIVVQARPVLSILPNRTNGGFTVSVKGTVGQGYRVQSATRLPNWADVLEFTLTDTDTITFDTPADNNSSARYYRAVSQ